ncbi:glycosyltransferase [Paenibacillus alkaliterrae]|uniref:MGDG synthase family glycosyltransferase n=1 Tax=Paenibacillus alkaliterrae TaxID=320909 RepID=UPI001F1FDC26|nr:glycosyltransferase [Paenibacillus alkaliterrae]MCF2938856.1 glycosyltransferase [Paenibacillus alkaliterrae]
MIRFENKQQPKLLILYASYGEGHLQVARAIRDAMEERGNYRTVMVDLMAESHPWLNEVTRRFYLKSYTHMPSLYGWMYDFTRPMKHDSLFGGLLHSFGRDKIRRILAAERPDAVVHTFPSFALPELKKRTGYHPPSYAIITDFDLHRRWVHPSIDRYYVATEDLKKELTLLGIPGSSVQVSGIPLKRGFRAIAPSAELFVRYKLRPDKPVVLIMAGAQGVMPDVEQICGGLLQDANVQVALVCGHNRLLKDSISEQFQHHTGAARLHVYGFVEQIHELMALSDCLITKPGGVTLSEAIAAELPIFTYRPVPGQEKQNALYLASKGAASIANHPLELTEQILKLIGDPLRLTSRRLSTQRLQASQSAADGIILDILSNLDIMERASNI